MKFHLMQVGRGSQPVVFLHGLFGQGRNFLSIANQLQSAATCYMVDLPNHGHSSWTVGFTLIQQADLVADWLRDNFSHPVTLVGHSLGGKIAMLVALRHPRLVAKLVVIDIAPSESETVAGFASLITALQRLPLEKLATRGQADELLAEIIPDKGTRAFLLQNLRRHSGHWSWLANLDLLADSLPEIASWPEVSGSFTEPVLWLLGGNSSYVQPEQEAAMRDRFPTTIRLVAKGAGHLVHVDRPQIVVDAIRQLLA
ncbi:MAG: alpha/beta hydrolase [Arachnia propionica]|nr:MAG: alpha/beta hydrolase [Arachnia propionica]